MKGLNIGAGPNFNIKDWEKLDYTGNSYGDNGYIPDINFDLNKIEPIPRPDNSYNYIYCSHVFEHLLDESVNNILYESNRLLKKDGIIRITCPDYDKLLYMYLNNIKINWDYGSKWNEQWSNFDCFLYNTFSFCHRRRENINEDKDYINEDKDYINEDKDYINENFFNKLLKEKGKKYTYNYCYEICKKYKLKYPDKFSGSHINWWNEEKITEYLQKNNFNDIKLYIQNESNSKDLIGNGFNNTLPHFSLYIEAKKL